MQRHVAQDVARLVVAVAQARTNLEVEFGNTTRIPIQLAKLREQALELVDKLNNEYLDWDTRSRLELTCDLLGEMQIDAEKLDAVIRELVMFIYKLSEHELKVAHAQIH